VTRRPRIAGTRALFLLPSIPDDLDPATKNALAVRNACATEGVCPCCHAVGELYADDELEGVFHIVFAHEPECVVLADGDAA
jgi:hypothetical protein